MNVLRTSAERGSGTGANELSLIKATARWCEFLHSNTPVMVALKALSEAADVDAVALSRVPHGSVERVGAVVYDRNKPTLGTARLDRAFGGMVLGAFSGSASPGTVWLKSLVAQDAARPLEAIQEARGWNELAIIPLAQTPKAMDVLEFHVSTLASERYYRVLNLLAGTLAETWEGRRPGLLTEMLLNRTSKASSNDLGIPLLSVENPARLSRAEFRVCLLLGQGLSNEKVMIELDISLTTLRTHLRNIYAKTGADGHSDLLYKLLNNAVSGSAVSTARARAAG
ncbi:MAG: helix-turn-helix transcriptional regulator [Pseudomonadota bacterium]